MLEGKKLQSIEKHSAGFFIIAAMTPKVTQPTIEFGALLLFTQTDLAMVSFLCLGYLCVKLKCI